MELTQNEKRPTYLSNKKDVLLHRRYIEGHNPSPKIKE